MTKAYLLGLLHDGTKRKKTYRIVQKEKEFIEFVMKGIVSLGQRAWMYKEGKNRNLYVVEFSNSFLSDYRLSTSQDKIDYIRGYFDAEGGISRKSEVRYYIYFAQKNLPDLNEVKTYLEELGIKCGKVHNPSKLIDPEYWRFFISSQSYKDFSTIIGSWHTTKKAFLM